MTVFAQPGQSYSFRANFGPSYAGLSTVQFELRDQNENVIHAFATTGVTETNE